MNELEPLRNLLVKPEPAQSVRDEGRRRLQQAIRTGPARFRRRPSWHVGGLALTGTAAVVVTVVGIGLAVPHGTARDDPATGSRALAPPAPLSADTILLSAASKVGKLPSTAAYWRTETRNVLSRREVPGKGYEIQMAESNEIWISGTSRGKNWRITQDLGYAPVTEADRAAWKADGAPTTWKLKNLRCIGSPHGTKRLSRCDQVVTAAPGPRRVDPLWRTGIVRNAANPESIGNLGNFDITLAQVRRLPVDPVALRAELTRRLPGAVGQELNTILFEVGTHLITDLPASSGVRAAAYKMIAALPGVRSTGEMSDPLGRRGQTVVMGEDGSTEIMARLIINPATGLPLATQTFQAKDGRILRSGTVTRIGWTDDRPVLS